MSVALELRDVEVDVLPAVAGAVGEALLLQRPDDLEHLVDVVRGARVRVGRLHPQASKIVQEHRRPVARDLPGIAAFLLGLGDHLVLAFIGVPHQVTDVGDVHHLAHVVAAILEPAPQQVGEQEGAEVADVLTPIDRRAAVVHPHAPLLEGLQGLDRAGVRVVEARRGAPVRCVVGGSHGVVGAPDCSPRGRAPRAGSPGEGPNPAKGQESPIATFGP